MWRSKLNSYGLSIDFNIDRIMFNSNENKIPVRLKMKKHSIKIHGKKNSSIDEAVKYGIDLSLLDINLRKTPEQRIQDMNNAWLAILELQKAVKSNGK